MKARIIMRNSFPDNNGVMTGWTYTTTIVDIPETDLPQVHYNGKICPPDVIGAEWIKEESPNEQ